MRKTQTGVNYSFRIVRGLHTVDTNKPVNLFFGPQPNVKTYVLSPSPGQSTNNKSHRCDDLGAAKPRITALSTIKSDSDVR